MARATLNLKILLENVHCHDEGDGWGNAEPYLWPIFFKIDGDSYAVEAGSGLIGFPTIESRNGHHGNLNNTDVDAGNDVQVPETLGLWQTTLKPIPINDPFIKSLIGEDLPGIAGVIVVLMEEDNWPDSLADIGYNALVNSVQLAVAKVAAGFQKATHAPTKPEIDAAIQTVKDTASSMVHDAVKGTMSGWQLLWYGTFGNNDDTIGSEVWTFDHDAFAQKAVNEFSRRWSGDESGDGDWDISGSFTGLVPCPADALSKFLGGTNNRMSRGIGGQTGSAQTLSAMRDFRAKDYMSLPGLELWWRALQGGTADVVRIASRKPEVRNSLSRVFTAIPGLLATPDQSVPPEFLHDLTAILEEMSTSSPLLHRTFARRALTLMPELHGLSWNATIKRFAQVRPLGRDRSREEIAPATGRKTGTVAPQAQVADIGGNKVSPHGNFGVSSQSRKSDSFDHSPTLSKTEAKNEIRFQSDPSLDS